MSSMLSPRALESHLFPTGNPAYHTLPRVPNRRRQSVECFNHGKFGGTSGPFQGASAREWNSIVLGIRAQSPSSGPPKSNCVKLWRCHNRVMVGAEPRHLANGFMLRQTPQAWMILSRTTPAGAARFVSTFVTSPPRGPSLDYLSTRAPQLSMPPI
jgi:hypothetical protein